MASPGLLPPRVVRAIKNDPRMGNGIMNEAAGVIGPAVPVARKPNATYGMADFHRIMIAACVLGISAFGYAAAVRRILTDRRKLDRNHRVFPCGEWIRNVIARVDAPLLTGSFASKISEQVSILKGLGVLSGRMDVAIDMHLIPRWDTKKTADLARSKMKSGTTWFERYVTVQVVKAGSQITVAARRMPALEDTAAFVDQVISLCGKGGVHIRTILLDREFFSVRVIGVLDRAGVGYLMPCTNTDGVVAAIREFAAGRRPAVSTHTIRKSKNEYATYTMIITKRRRRKSKKKSSSTANPEDIYIAFATNRPGINVNRYAKRWMIETGYRMIENQRVRTRSKTVAARLLCFLYSMLVYNVWVIANATSTGNRVYPRVTQTDLMLNTIVDLLPWELISGIPPDCPCGCPCPCPCNCHAAPPDVVPS